MVVVVVVFLVVVDFEFVVIAVVVVRLGGGCSRGCGFCGGGCYVSVKNFAKRQKSCPSFK